MRETVTEMATCCLRMVKMDIFVLDKDLYVASMQWGTFNKNVNVATIMFLCLVI